jgi:hypothetical protein
VGAPTETPERPDVCDAAPNGDQSHSALPGVDVAGQGPGVSAFPVEVAGPGPGADVLPDVAASPGLATVAVFTGVECRGGRDGEPRNLGGDENGDRNQSAIPCAVPCAGAGESEPGRVVLAGDDARDGPGVENGETAMIQPAVASHASATADVAPDTAATAAPTEAPTEASTRAAPPRSSRTAAARSNSAWLIGGPESHVGSGPGRDVGSGPGSDVGLLPSLPCSRRMSLRGDPGDDESTCEPNAAPGSNRRCGNVKCTPIRHR